MLCKDYNVRANKLTAMAESHHIGPSHGYNFVYTADVVQSKYSTIVTDFTISEWHFIRLTAS